MRTITLFMIIVVIGLAIALTAYFYLSYENTNDSSVESSEIKITSFRSLKDSSSATPTENYNLVAETIIDTEERISSYEDA